MSNTPPTEAVSTPPERSADEHRVRSAENLLGSTAGTSALPRTERTCAALLQTQPGEDFLKLGVCAQLGQLDVHAATQAGAQVGGAGQDVAQVLVPHEAVVVLLENLLNLEEEREGVKPGRGSSTSVELLAASCWLTFCRPTQKRLKTSRMLPPFCMEMTRRWSSSLIQTRKVLLSLCLQAKVKQHKEMKTQENISSYVWPSLEVTPPAWTAQTHQMPLASGQSRAIPAHVRRGETGLSNRKWSAISCSCSASVMDFRG